jgi:hypothetical protein
LKKKSFRRLTNVFICVFVLGQVSTAAQQQNNTGQVPTKAEMEKAYMALGKPLLINC